MWGFIWSLIIGGIIGWLGQLIIGKDFPGGVIGNIVIGFLGSALGGFLLGDLLGGWTIGDFAVIPAVIGAILVVFIWDLIATRL